MVPRAEAREARNAADAREAVEAAQAAAAAALAAELEVVRRGRADAEAREAALQEEVNLNSIAGVAPPDFGRLCSSKLLGWLGAGSWWCRQSKTQENRFCRESPHRRNSSISCGWPPVPPMSVWTCMAGALGVLHPFIAGCVRQCASVRDSCCAVRV